MSSLWTPGGEVPIDRGPTPPADDADRAEEPDQPDGDQDEALRQQVLDAPVAAIVAQHAVALYELAALHLSEPEPRLVEARLAIDALAALVDGLPGRLGEAESALQAALPQLRMAFVEATDRQRPSDG